MRARFGRGGAFLAVESTVGVGCSYRPAHVLIFCEKWESGGVEAFVTTLLECMDRSHLEVDLVACKVASGPYDVRLSAMGVHPVALGSSIRDLSGNLAAFKALLTEEAYDAVHLNIYEGMALAYARAAKKAGVPRVIVHSHNNALRPSATRAFKLAVHRACTGAMVGYADLRWAPSESAARFMFGSKPFTLVRNGIVPERFAFDPAVRIRCRQMLGFCDSDYVLGCVGRLCEQKNQLFLLEVLAALPESAHARLLLVGEDDGDGSYEKALRRRADELALAGRVTFYGGTDDTAPLYQAMDALCVPSTFEALGIVAVEGQAAGLTVVASPAVPPEAHAGGSLTRVALDALQWAAALAAVLSQPCQRERGVANVRAAGYDMRCVAAEVLRGYGCKDAHPDMGAPSRITVGRTAETDSAPVLVSVIVPVYNVAPYVAECLEAIRAQTHENLEVIMVDDGSTDASGAICDAMAAADWRFAVIHQPNAGLSAARNAGLDSAHGDYIAFVDSDDVISPRFVEVLLAPHSDIAQCAFTTEEPALSSAPSGLIETVSSREASLALQFDSTGNAAVVWNKLYRAELLEGIRFPAGKQHEDEFVTYRLLWKARTVSMVPEPLYYYRQRPGSIMGTGVSRKTFDAFEGLEGRAAFYQAQGDEELAALTGAVLCNRIGTALPAIASMDSACAKAWSFKRDGLLSALLKSPYINFKKKIALLAQRVMPGTYARLKGLT